MKRLVLNSLRVYRVNTSPLSFFVRLMLPLWRAAEEA